MKALSYLDVVEVYTSSTQTAEGSYAVLYMIPNGPRNENWRLIHIWLYPDDWTSPTLFCSCLLF